jgi:hypothetical protein
MASPAPHPLYRLASALPGGWLPSKPNHVLAPVFPDVPELDYGLARPATNGRKSLIQRNHLVDQNMVAATPKQTVTIAQPGVQRRGDRVVNLPCW